RKKDGTWSVENSLVGNPSPRNYVVDIVPLDSGNALYAHTVQGPDGDLYGTIHFHMLDELSNESLGCLERDDNLNLYRIDADFRMERYQDTLHVSTGKPDPDGYVYYMKAEIGSEMVRDLSGSVIGHWAGEGRRGMPDLRIDKAGNTFLTYGSYQSVVFVRYSNDGSDDIRDKPIMHDMGEWHLDLGLSATAASSEGDTLLVVGLLTNGTKEALNSALCYTYSVDGGENWVYPAEIPDMRTNGGEGRMRPRIKYYKSKFYVFYNNISGGIAITTIDLKNTDLLKANNPVISPEKDTITELDSISMESADSDVIFYSSDFDPLNSNDTPDLFSTKYESPFSIDRTGTIYAIAYKSGYLPSDIVSASKQFIISSAIPNELNKKYALCLYPVPATTSVSVEANGNYSGHVTIDIHNPLGQRVYSDRAFKTSTMFQHEINVSNWPAGVYILVLKNEPGDTWTRKFIINK
ncbi:MAG: T9SS type A sorting domain-containing protein, partial [Bacteroidota bacterium]|nr:T9SS type A sorting domain-containing protein [Bacteroidota bacterium]